MFFLLWLCLFFWLFTEYAYQKSRVDSHCQKNWKENAYLRRENSLLYDYLLMIDFNCHILYLVKTSLGFWGFGSNTN